VSTIELPNGMNTDSKGCGPLASLHKYTKTGSFLKRLLVKNLSTSMEHAINSSVQNRPPPVPILGQTTRNPVLTIDFFTMSLPQSFN